MHNSDGDDCDDCDGDRNCEVHDNGNCDSV